VLDHAGGAVVGDTFFVVGGRINGSFAGNVNSVYALNLRTKSLTWTRKANLPTARSGLAVAVVGSKIYTFGGEGDRTNTKTYVFDDVEVYDTKTNTWTILPSWPLPR
jgi:N-acetylneuraminic acid mutarotase